MIHLPSLTLSPSRPLPIINLLSLITEISISIVIASRQPLYPQYPNQITPSSNPPYLYTQTQSTFPRLDSKLIMQTSTTLALQTFRYKPLTKTRTRITLSMLLLICPCLENLPDQTHPCSLIVVPFLPLGYSTIFLDLSFNGLPLMQNDQDPQTQAIHPSGRLRPLLDKHQISLIIFQDVQNHQHKIACQTHGVLKLILNQIAQEALGNLLIRLPHEITTSITECQGP